MKMTRRGFLQVFGAAVGTLAVPKLALAAPELIVPPVAPSVIGVDLAGGIDWGHIISLSMPKQDYEIIPVWRRASEMMIRKAMIPEIDVETYLTDSEFIRHLSDVMYNDETVEFDPPILRQHGLQPIRCYVHRAGIIADVDQAITARVLLVPTGPILSL